MPSLRPCKPSSTKMFSRKRTPRRLWLIAGKIWPVYPLTKSQRRALLPKTSTRKGSLPCGYKIPQASRCSVRCKTVPCASASRRPRSRVIVRGGRLILVKLLFAPRNYERNGPSYSVTKTMPLISWKTRQPKIFQP